MKKITLSAASLLLLISVSVHAQTDALYAVNTPHPKNSGNDYASSGNERAVSNFKKEFSTAENASWSKLTDGYLTTFEQHNIKYRVGYSPKGNWENTVRTYQSDNLPASVKNIIDYVYDGYHITLVDEITTLQKTVYVVHIENSERIRQVKIDNDKAYDLEEYEVEK